MFTESWTMTYVSFFAKWGDSQLGVNKLFIRREMNVQCELTTINYVNTMFRYPV